ncbi:N-glycosylase/DNA lyase-like [Asterias amurensis]|uniref:N-glycosylase/DNA lyase-like n=1 Tax=Asterias amurensis TaxID=7602 RepID=UPI003AB2A4FB
MASTWRSLPCKISELRLDITLACGQSFRWKEIQPGIWRSVLAGRVWTLKQTDDEILYQVHPSDAIEPDNSVPIKQEFPPPKKGSKLKQPAKKETRKVEDGDTKVVQFIKEEKKDTTLTLGDDYSTILKDYFQLSVNLEKLYKKWKAADSNFNTKVAPNFPGVRVLRQDPTENVFSFICSSNNNISRITGMVDKLCSFYGKELAVLDGTTWFTFPTAEALAQDGVEQVLRDKGFGYRAKFISQTAKFIEKQPKGWLESIRELEYEEAHAELVKLPGVGAKVADCVCLMSMDKPNAIPVDTHVWQIACRDYIPTLHKTKSLTDKVYKEVGEFFRALFGEYAGWAHSVLFSADLKKFQLTGQLPNSPDKKKNRKRESGDAEVGKQFKGQKKTKK